jgi:AcrR family transcriptional regulator
MEDPRQYIKMSELSELSGTPIPSIRYYIRTGVLPKAIKAKATSAYYTDQHLERLKLIKEMQLTKNPSTALLKKMIDSVNQIEGKGEISYPDASQIIRDKIINSSIPIFRKKGYERTTITDLAESAGIGRNTFYQSFNNKQEVFIECLTKIFFDWRKAAPPEGTIPIAGLIKKMFLSSYKSFPEWNDMLNIFRSSATKYPSIFAKKLEESLNIRIKPIVNDIERGIKQGEIREVNSELVGIMIAGIVEYVSYYMLRGRFQDPDAVIAATVDILFDGLSARSPDTGLGNAVSGQAFAKNNRDVGRKE